MRRYSVPNTMGWLLILIGLLSSPIKPRVIRCWSNPAGWLETQCANFKELHASWGYVFLVAGVALVLASFLHPKQSES